MSRIPRTTVEQWAVLRAVVDEESFAQAAEALNRSQSSVSYAVARLQERLEIQLLEIDGRRAVLTEAGRALLAEAIPLIDDLARLEERGHAIGRGAEPRIRLIIDSLFPKSRLFAALQALRDSHPHARVDLEEIVRRTTPDPLMHAFDLAIAMPDPGTRHGRRLIDIELIAVARADHPLVARGTSLSTATLARHLRIDIQREGSVTAEGGSEVWQVSTIEVAVGAVLEGLGYAWLPRHMIERELADGRICGLRLRAGDIRLVPLDLSFSDEEQAGPGVLTLARLLMAG